LEMIGGLHYRAWLFQPNVNAPSVTLTIQGHLSDSPYWISRRPGILAPVLKWECVDDPGNGEEP
jgi:lipopolysaccharide transport system ATP-binding protein